MLTILYCVIQYLVTTSFISCMLKLLHNSTGVVVGLYLYKIPYKSMPKDCMRSEAAAAGQTPKR